MSTPRNDQFASIPVAGTLNGSGIHTNRSNGADHDDTIEVIAQKMASDPAFEKELLAARAKLTPIDNLRSARDAAIEAAGRVNEVISEGAYYPGEPPLADDALEALLFEVGELTEQAISGANDHDQRLGFLTLIQRLIEAPRINRSHLLTHVRDAAVKCSENLIDDMARVLTSTDPHAALNQVIASRADWSFNLAQTDDGEHATPASDREKHYARITADDDTDETPEFTPPQVREAAEVNPIPLRDSAGANEIERLVADAIGDDDRDQSLALLELLTILTHDGSNWALTAKQAVIRASGELSDEGGDLLVTAAQRQRRAAANPAVLDDRGLLYAFQKMTEAGGTLSYLVALASHFSALADLGDLATVRAHSETLIDYCYAKDNEYDETRETYLAEEVAHFPLMVNMDDMTTTPDARAAAFHASELQRRKRESEGE